MLVLLNTPLAQALCYIGLILTFILFGFTWRIILMKWKWPLLDQFWSKNPQNLPQKNNPKVFLPHPGRRGVQPAGRPEPFLIWGGSRNLWRPHHRWMDEDDIPCLQNSVQVKFLFPNSPKFTTLITKSASNRSPGSLPVPRRLVTTALYMSIIPLLLTLVCILRWVIFILACLGM